MMTVSREEALQAVDNLFNYCEEIDHSLPENERTGYKMLPDVHKIRKYIIDNSHPRGEWTFVTHYCRRYRVCSICGAEKEDDRATGWNYCQHCGSDNRPEEGEQK